MNSTKQHCNIVALRMASLLLAGFFLYISGTTTALAQKPAPLADPIAAQQAQELVKRFFAIATTPKGVPQDSIRTYAIAPFSDLLKKRIGKSFWEPETEFTVGSVQSIRPGDTLITVNAVTYPDSLRWIGRFEVDWVFFLKPHEQGGWRISDLRRLMNVEKKLELIAFMDTTTVFPDRVKDIIIREKTAALLSNRLLRQHFQTHHSSFVMLRSLMQHTDSLLMIQRINRYPSQINYTTIQWGEAAEDIPQEVLDEYLKNASPEERDEIQARLEAFEKKKQEGRESVKKIARDNSIDINRLDSVIQHMYDLRISYINTRLPWPGSILFTVDGTFDDAIGYLYVPEEYAPVTDPDEYFYLEDLGGGWWIFRST